MATSRYIGDLTWTILSAKVGDASRRLIDELFRAEQEYEDWITFRDGRSNAVIATALAVPESNVADLDKAFRALHAIHDYARNGTPSRGDHAADMRKFS